MPHHTPLTPVIACLPQIPDEVPDSTPSLVCGCCGDTMKHFRTIPGLGVRQQQLMFVCPSCKAVDTRVRRIFRVPRDDAPITIAKAAEARMA